MNAVRLLAAALAALALAAPAAAQEKFKVGYLRVMDDAQAILADKADLYARRGVDVELVEFKSGTDLIKAIVGGQLHSGVLGFTNAIAWASRGADLKVVGGAQNGYHAMIVREEAGIEKIADLKGRTIASQKEGSTADTVLKGVVFKQAGLAPADVGIMGVSPQVAVQSLVAKRVDAAFLFEPQASIVKAIAPVKRPATVTPKATRRLSVSSATLPSARPARAGESGIRVPIRPSAGPIRTRILVRSSRRNEL